MIKKSKTKVEDAVAEAKPAEAKPAQVKPAQAKPAEIKPAESKPAGAARRPAAKPAAGKAAKAAAPKSAAPKSAAPAARAPKAARTKATQAPPEPELETLETVAPIPANRPVGSVPRPKPKPGDPANRRPRLSISSKNYSSWSLRGWLICKLAGLEFDTVAVGADDPAARAELLLMAPSYRVPRLRDGEVDVWDTLAIADYLHETHEASHIYPRDVAKRAHCRAVCGEMHSGFANLRSALPFNIKGHYPGFKIWAGAQADIDHICEIWRDCLSRYGGPYLFGPNKTIADAMFAPVCSRFVTYDVQLDSVCAAYRDHIMSLPLMQEWVAAALEEPDEVEELDVEF
jgi:glutathione S-transferase